MTTDQSRVPAGWRAWAIGLFSVVVFAVPALAQQPVAGRAVASAPSDGLYLTVFRSPATGFEYRRRWLGVFGGFYPTILTVDGKDEGDNTNFIRAGVALYWRSVGWSPYVAPSFVFSLDDEWDHGALSEFGVRIPIGGRVSVRGGVGVLTTFDGETRVNPTIGLDIRLGSQ